MIVKKYIHDGRTRDGDAEAEISQFGYASGAEKHVFRFDVPVNDVPVVLKETDRTNVYNTERHNNNGSLTRKTVTYQVFDGQHDLSKNIFCLRLVHPALGYQPFEQLSGRRVLHD